MENTRGGGGPVVTLLYKATCFTVYMKRVRFAFMTRVIVPSDFSPAFASLRCHFRFLMNCGCFLVTIKTCITVSDCEEVIAVAFSTLHYVMSVEPICA